MEIKRALSAAAALALLAGGTAAAQSSSNPNGQQVDKTFVQKAAKANTKEIREAHLELASKDPQARQFAQRMIRDHSKAESQLASVANLLGYSAEIRSGVNSADPAGKEPGAKYVKTEVKDHQQAIALFEEEAQRGRNPTLRGYAEHTIPTLRQHLAMAQRFSGASGAPMNAHSAPMRKQGSLGKPNASQTKAPANIPAKPNSLGKPKANTPKHHPQPTPKPSSLGKPGGG